VTLSNNAPGHHQGRRNQRAVQHAAQGDDVYNDAGEISLGIKSAVDVDGRTFENLQLGGAASVQVTDTTDEVVAKLTATPSVTEGGEITYTITLTNKDGLPINNHSADLHAERRQNRHHRAGQRHRGSTTVTAPDNVYVGTNDPVVKSIATVEGADVGKFEQLTLDKTRSAPPSPTSQVLQATKATWSRSPSPPTRPRWPRTSNRPSPCTSTPPLATTWS
jgi:surface adhesion protein